jgi:isocitrate/isopropylmalate dehydrogenase
LPDKTLRACRSASAVLLGAVGGPQWPKPATVDMPSPPRPEQGLLKLRKELNLYANIRPCYFPAESLMDKSPLKKEILKGTDFIVVRELTGGLYFGERQEEKDGQGMLYFFLSFSCNFFLKKMQSL